MALALLLRTPSGCGQHLASPNVRRRPSSPPVKCSGVHRQSLQSITSLQSYEDVYLRPPEDDFDVAQEDEGLGRRLSALSNNSKHAFTLNQVQRVKVCATYDRDDEDGATVYVLDVYLQYAQRGLPTTPGETKSERRSRLQQEKEETEPEYQVEHRYSAFRALRKRIAKIVHDREHLRWCAYCSRVTWIASVESFPSRFPNKGNWAQWTGWRRLQVHLRKRKLQRFVNQLLRAAKDLSYRRGGGQCQRFLDVSQILNTFLMDPDLRPEGCVW